MPRRSVFKHHRFPRDIILCAVRWYLRYPLSYQDVVDLPSERGAEVDRSTVFCWVQKFSPELTKRTEKHLRRASVDWHVDEAYAYRRVIRKINHRYDPHFDGIRHIDRQWRNNLVESDHAAMPMATTSRI
ncbi:hypothetical protein [Ruegeria sp. A3M17]|uniref:hypothetical protein n=1 Tax=Ruegeria sp. A3M17 TaxID=2267229 RepID=UPI002695CE06